MITIGSFRERFLVSLNYWSVDDYEKQWVEAIRRIVDNYPVSCLIASIADPSAGVIFSWPIYRVGDNAVFHNQLFFPDTLSSPFDASKAYSYVRDRETADEDGDQISEWRVNVGALRAFVDQHER